MHLIGSMRYRCRPSDRVDPPERALDSPPTPEVLARFHAELDLVDIVARQIGRRLPPSVASTDDLRSFGREGLLSAARTFDASRGVPFRRWANVRIRGAIIDGVRQWGDMPRRVYRELRAIEAGDRMLEAYDEEDAGGAPTTPEAADERLSSYLAGIATAIAVGTVCVTKRENVDLDGRNATPEALVMDREVLGLVQAIVEQLPPQERTLVERHYFAGETLDAIASSMGLSKSWGSRLHARAIESIGKELRKRL
jgi:RNA polymerase sigma factor for flagellar operon FliA